jgi:hypothetical protein
MKGAKTASLLCGQLYSTNLFYDRLFEHAPRAPYIKPKCHAWQAITKTVRNLINTRDHSHCNGQVHTTRCQQGRGKTAELISILRQTGRHPRGIVKSAEGLGLQNLTWSRPASRVAREPWEGSGAKAEPRGAKRCTPARRREGPFLLDFQQKLLREVTAAKEGCKVLAACLQIGKSFKQARKSVPPESKLRVSPDLVVLKHSLRASL